MFVRFLPITARVSLRRCSFSFPPPTPSLVFSALLSLSSRDTKMEIVSGECYVAGLKFFRLIELRFARGFARKRVSTDPSFSPFRFVWARIARARARVISSVCRVSPPHPPPRVQRRTVGLSARLDFGSARPGSDECENLVESITEVPRHGENPTFLHGRLYHFPGRDPYFGTLEREENGARARARLSFPFVSFPFLGAGYA